MNATSRAQLLGMIDGYRLSQAISTAAELGIADLCASAPMSSETMAAATGCHEPTLRRLLNALASAGLLEVRADGQFRLTALGKLLRSDLDGSLRAWAVLSARLYRSWAELPTSVRTGKGGGRHRWNTLEREPAESRLFNDAMRANASCVAQALQEAWDLSAFCVMADVGGGDGSVLEAVLALHPATRGVLIELPGAIRDARARLQSCGVLDRVALREGDFFETVPEGADLYLLARVLHDWDDERATLILRRIHSAMRPNAMLMIVERILDSDCPRLETALSDLNMLVMNGGRERTAREFELLLDRSGFELKRCIGTSTPLHVLACVPMQEHSRAAQE